GMFEDKRFSFGTVELLKSLKGSKAFSVLGGGHSVAAVESYGLSEFVSYISSGGGAMISFLSGEKLPGIEALEKAK
ncbi:MAG: phosphoglycerate kinase, partial [Thermoproteota archaeon]